VENFLKRGHAQETREYVEEHRIAEIIEPILIELIINGAENGANAKIFLLEKLKEIQEKVKKLFKDIINLRSKNFKGLNGVKWNHFIPNIRPDQKSMTRKTRDEIERIDSYGPSEEKFYVAAYNFRYKKLKAEFLNVWQIFVEQRKERRRIKAIQNKMAKEHFEKSIRKYDFPNGKKIILFSFLEQKALKNWFSITRLQAARNHEASKKLAKMYCLHFGKFYVRAWDAFTKQSLKTKRYFDQIEKGEIEDYNALLSNKDADAIYRLPRMIAIKIFSYLNIEEISICRAVSREWNIITQARVQKD